MPLRSVEAATRDDAIAAAREQFGPSARVVGVRRVRSGGVLGFFATERYVAEVAPDPVGAPSLPVAAPARPAGALTEDPDTGSLAAYGSPLASAAPARARTAPPRNGAAAWAAEAARSSAPAAALVGASVGRPVEVARPLAERDDERVDELAGLLGAPTPPPVQPASFPRATRPDPVPAPAVEDVPTTGAPSPFTAALARMVAGDRDVQHAVRQALETSDAARAADEPGELPASHPEATNQSAVWSRATHQEEETVGDQVIAPPSTSVDERTESTSWADEPSTSFESSFTSRFADELPVAESAPVSREEAIAEVLRAALAEGHSDDALAGILRKVVAGDSPDAALADPVEPVAPVLPTATPAPVELLDLEPTADEPAVEEPAVDELPEVEIPATEPAAPATAYFDLFSPVTPPAAAVPVADPAPSAPVELWGEVSSAPAPAARVEEPAAASAPIWAEVTVPEAAAEPAPAAETPLFETPETETEADVAGADVAEAPVESADVALDLAPVLARTASDPAPVSPPVTMDATTVMPPLSLLPGSPSRGRGLPPVPPRSGRPPVPPSQGRGTATSSAAVGSMPGPRTPDLLATVTRLPVAPLMATPETPELPQLAELADLIEADGSGLPAAPDLPAAVPARPTRVRIDPPTTPAEVVSRLTDLGVPTDLLGTDFTTAVEADGTYAALTRVLGERLPEAPELPTGAGDVLFVVGPGVETLRAARSLAATLRLDPDRVQWATRGDLVGLAPETSRMSTIDTALRRRQDAASTGTVTIVAVDAPLRTDAYWMAQMLAIWSPVAVWAVVEATRKPEDLEHWVDGLARVDALIVQDTDLSADPAAVLHRLAAPVAVVDGVRATPHRWASMLCERLESAPA